MKLSYAVTCPDIKSESIPAYGGDLDEALKTLVALGYDGVELMVRDPAKLSWKEISRLCSENGLEVTVVCTGELYGEGGLSLIAPDEKIRKEAFRRMKEVVEFAARFRAGVNIGRVRGNFCKEVDRSTSLDWAVSAFSDLASLAETHDVCLVLEPINRFQCNFVNTTQEGIDMVRRIDSSHFQLMVDLFHMNIEDVSIEESIVEASECLRHVHVCDSNRHAPGHGHLDFPVIVGALKRIDYQGFLSGEILSIPDGYSTAKSTIEFLKPLL